MVAALFATSAEADPIALKTLVNQVTPWTGTGTPLSTATIAGYDGGVVSGAYEGSALATTDAEWLELTIGGSGDAGAKIDWHAELVADYPVDQLFLNLYTFLDAVDDEDFLLGDVNNLSEFTYEVSELYYAGPTYLTYWQIGSGDVMFDSGGQSLDTTYTIPTYPTYYSTKPTDFLINAEFDVASSFDILGPGSASVITTGGVDFTLSAEGSVPAPTVPEPATVLLVGTGLIGLGASSLRRRH